MNNSRSQRNKDKKNKKKKTKIVLISIFAVLLFAVGFSSFYYYNKIFAKIENVPIDQTPKNLGIDDAVQDRIGDVDEKGEIINIALFGLDQQNIKEPGRSDSIMVLTIDKNRKKLKLSSIIRDSYVKINGHEGRDKITHAYAFGGPQLAIRTLNENFGLNIKDYVTVNFFGMSKIIDALGGVTINLKSDEIEKTNYYIREISNIEKIPYDYVTKSGNQVLSGIQAVAYTRNRETGNGDFERTERQRRVLSALMEKIENMSVAKYPELISQLLPYTVTSMNSKDIISLATSVASSGTKNIEQERFPVDGYASGQTIKGVYYYVYDEKPTKDQIFKYIFEDVKPTPKQ